MPAAKGKRMEKGKAKVLSCKTDPSSAALGPTSRRVTQRWGKLRVATQAPSIQTKASSLNTRKSQLVNLKGESGMEDRKRGDK